MPNPLMTEQMYKTAIVLIHSMILVGPENEGDYKKSKFAQFSSPKGYEEACSLLQLIW